MLGHSVTQILANLSDVGGLALGDGGRVAGDDCRGHELPGLAAGCLV